MKLRTRAQALADIDAIDRFVDQLSPGGADNVLRAIYASIHPICEHPLAYPQTDDPDIRVHVIRRYRTKIFHTTIGDAVEIIHVRHGARRPLAGRLIGPTDLTT